MDKKTLTLCISGILLLSALIAVSVFFLYSDGNFTRNIFSADQSAEDRCSPAPKAMTVKTSRDVVSQTVEASSSKDGKSVRQENPTKWAVTLMGRSYAIEQNSKKEIVVSTIGSQVLWTYPLDGKIAGMIGKVDFYANGKEQLIFVAGTKLHILSRLGKEVEGFPVDLKVSVILGPDVYDFTGAKRYNIMVLTKDNKIEMYNLKGEKHKNWKSISHKEDFTSLPSSFIVHGKNYWAAWTSGHTLVYPFYGGDVIKECEGRLTMEDVKKLF